MARKRFITSDMGKDEDIVDIAEINSILALMWPWFITAFDDWGRLEITSFKQVKLDVFKAIPLDTKLIEDAINAFISSKLVHMYEIGKRRYIAIEPCKFYKYQTYIRDKKRVEDNSNIPGPVNAPWVNCTHCRADARRYVPSPSLPPSIHDDDEEMRARIGKVFQFFNQNINPLPSPFQNQLLTSYLNDGFEPELILEILKDSLGKSEKWTWISRVLSNSMNEGVKTFAQYQYMKDLKKNKGKGTNGKKGASFSDLVEEADESEPETDTGSNDDS